jgi:hypothetical protein
LLHRRTIERAFTLAVLGALAACHGSQPTIQQTNETTNAELSAINATTTNTDGMDQGNAELMATPTTGQAMDAKEQPLK